MKKTQHPNSQSVLCQKSKVATTLTGGKTQKSLRQNLGHKHHQSQCTWRTKDFEKLAMWPPPTNPASAKYWRRNVTVLSAVNTDKGPSEIISTTICAAKMTRTTTALLFWNRDGIPITLKLERPHPREQISLGRDDVFANLTLAVAANPPRSL